MKTMTFVASWMSVYEVINILFFLFWNLAAMYEREEEQRSSNSTNKWSLYYQYSSQTCTHENQVTKARFYQKAHLNGSIHLKIQTISWYLPTHLSIFETDWRKKEKKRRYD